jgi:outer membrane protein assembly factor BamA
LRNFFPANRHPAVRYVCESNKQTDECGFGQVDVKTHLVLTQTSGANQVPFYLQPTLGGTDVDSQVSLRGWDNYRFRARDLALIQFEYGIPVYDPVGLLLFYDAGTVGNTDADLTISHFRQDAGIGATVRLRGHVLAQTYFAWGAGHGAQWNYNFAKSF